MLFDQIKNPIDRFNAVLKTLKPGDIAIDCGANVGDITKKLLGRGCVVYVYEPDPSAFRLLRERVGSHPNAVIVNAAVGDANGTAKLYFHKDIGATNDIALTQASSLKADKRNVNTANFVAVKVIDLCEFVESRDRDVSVLKIDIEGGEVDVLGALLERGTYKRVKHTFVETHEIKVPSSKVGMDEVRNRIASLGLTNIYLDWK